jgi:hypothetical protein
MAAECVPEKVHDRSGVRNWVEQFRTATVATNKPEAEA